ncbi:MAG: helix-turn-helix transcriptional regulator [Ignavibacteriales bacterium]|nr:hypothetical protein [Ignavibacteriaceae bacterium]MCK6614310.1 helix-turn-helix domain-containing protein [Ignavibacteriaceae bacterium]QOJ27861.1 MAG: helix-turn-helix transcriptional regulator [Ignavibacteriales bacterium]
MLPLKVSKTLKLLGENIQLARLRRRLSMAQIAERAGISRPTLTAIEAGKPNVSIGNYAMVLFILGLLDDLTAVARDDVFGRKLQDAGIIVKKRAPGKRRSDNG